MQWCSQWFQDKLNGKVRKLITSSTSSWLLCKCSDQSIGRQRNKAKLRPSLAKILGGLEVVLWGIKGNFMIGAPVYLFSSIVVVIVVKLKELKALYKNSLSV